MLELYSNSFILNAAFLTDGEWKLKFKKQNFFKFDNNSRKFSKRSKLLKSALKRFAPVMQNTIQKRNPTIFLIKQSVLLKISFN